MTRSDIFVLKETGLYPFLLAEIGPEENGSSLTMLSALSRLGQDPWAEAACWARQPHEAVAKHLSGLILQMPLRPQVLADAPRIAARLSKLLPDRASQLTGVAGERTTAFLLVAGVCVGVSFALLFIASQAPNRTAPPEAGLSRSAR